MPELTSRDATSLLELFVRELEAKTAPSSKADFLAMRDGNTKSPFALTIEQITQITNGTPLEVSIPPGTEIEDFRFPDENKNRWRKLTDNMNGVITGKLQYQKEVFVSPTTQPNQPPLLGMAISTAPVGK